MGSRVSALANAGKAIPITAIAARLSCLIEEARLQRPNHEIFDEVAAG